MYKCEFHIHPQKEGVYDLDEEDAIVFSQENEYIYNVKRLDGIWDIIEEHPELDDATFMVEAFLTDEDAETEPEIVEESVDTDDSENVEEVVDEADEPAKYLEDWKFVIFADVLRIVDTPIDSNPDVNKIYRDGSTLSVMAYEDGELPNLNGMVSELGPEERICSFDESGRIVVGPALTVDDEEDVDTNIKDSEGPGDLDPDNAGDEDDDNSDADDDSGNTSVGEGGKIELEP